MKKLAIVPAVILSFVLKSYGQEFDRTGFTGEVISQLVIEANEASETEVETTKETVIIFASKNITIDGETYAIVSKEFDGIDFNTFLVSKSGSNYTISFIVDDFIAISDNNKPDQVTYYMELTE